MRSTTAWSFQWAAKRLFRLRRLETFHVVNAGRVTLKVSLSKTSETQALLELGKLPLQILDLLVSPNKLARITSSTTLGAGITIAFEPTDVLLALVTALRTGNLDSFLKHGEIGSTPLYPTTRVN